MKIGSKSQEILEYLNPGEGIGLTIGNFDGVHRGHQALLKDFVDDCKNYNLKSLVLTFDPHPKHILSPRDPYAARLFPIEDLTERMREHSVDFLWVQEFSMSLAQLTPEEFIAKFLQALPIKYLLVGHDFRFGKERKGRIEDLLTWCEMEKVPLKVFSPYEIDGKRVSSSLIKDLLIEGDLDNVEHFLGRKYNVSGTVVPGHKRGGGIGFPTANLNQPIPLKNGVYLTILKVDNKSYKAITNVGLRPTVNSNMDLWNKNIETHVPDETLSLYDKKIEVEFHKYVRTEKKFNSLDELKNQILLDLDFFHTFWK